jgi:regulatory protein
VVAALEQNKILDERQYIEHFISYQAGRGQGPNRIGRKLRTLGLDFEQVGELLEAGQDWVSRAREVRRKKFGAVLPMVREDRLRQSSFLHYRGFTTAQIREALKENVDIDVCA